MINSDIIISGTSKDLSKIAARLPSRWELINVEALAPRNSKNTGHPRIHLVVCNTENSSDHMRLLERKLRSMLPRIRQSMKDMRAKIHLSMFATNANEDAFVRNLPVSLDFMNLLCRFDCTMNICVAPEQLRE